MNRAKSFEAHAIDANTPSIILVDFNHPDGSEYFHNHVAAFPYEGKIYWGCGALGSIVLGDDNDGLAPRDITITLSGIPAEIRSKINYSVKGGTVLVREAFLRPVDWKVDKIRTIEDAQLDVMEQKVANGNDVIVVTAIGGVPELRSRSAALWEPEEQNALLALLGIDPASDTGFDQISNMRNKIIVSKAE